MANFSQLLEIMKENNITDKMIASALGIDLSTWYRRKLAPQKITIGEAQEIKDLLNLSDETAASIFLH